MEQKSFTRLGERFVPGDVVRTGPNCHPRYKVVAVAEDKVWLRNLTSGADAVVDCRRCVVVEPSDRRLDAEVATPA
jgi:hypothetical protein